MVTSVPATCTTDGHETLDVRRRRRIQTYVRRPPSSAPGARSGRNRPRRVHPRHDLPGRSQVYVPLTALPMESLPDLFVHPGGYCQNVLATGDCRVVGSTTVAGRSRSSWSVTTRARSKSRPTAPTSRSASPSTGWTA